MGWFCKKLRSPQRFSPETARHYENGLRRATVDPGEGKMVLCFFRNSVVLIRHQSATFRDPSKTCTSV